MAPSSLSLGKAICIFCPQLNISAEGTWNPVTNTTIWICKNCTSFWSSPSFQHILDGVPAPTSRPLEVEESDVSDPDLAIRANSFTLDVHGGGQPELAARPTELDLRPTLSAGPEVIPSFRQFVYDDRLHRESSTANDCTIAGSVPTTSVDTRRHLTQGRAFSGCFLQSNPSGASRTFQGQSTLNHHGITTQYVSSHSPSRTEPRSTKSPTLDAYSKATPRHDYAIDNSSLSAGEDTFVAGWKPARNTRRIRCFRSPEMQWKYTFQRNFGVCDRCRIKKLSCSPTHLAPEVLRTVPQETWDTCPRAEWLAAVDRTDS